MVSDVFGFVSILLSVLVSPTQTITTGYTPPASHTCRQQCLCVCVCIYTRISLSVSVCVQPRTAPVPVGYHRASPARSVSPCSVTLCEPCITHMCGPCPFCQPSLNLTRVLCPVPLNQGLGKEVKPRWLG